MENKQDLFVKMALDSWNTYISRTSKIVDSLTDEQMAWEVSPARNSGIYLLGHLTAVHDAMLPLLGLGEKLYPSLESIFIQNPDKSGIDKPAVSVLRDQWKEVNNALSIEFQKLTAEEWFAKHTAVSKEAFVKEPHRNRLNVLMNRTNHLSSHYGQLLFLQS